MGSEYRQKLLGGGTKQPLRTVHRSEEVVSLMLLPMITACLKYGELVSIPCAH